MHPFEGRILLPNQACFFTYGYCTKAIGETQLGDDVTEVKPEGVATVMWVCPVVSGVNVAVVVPEPSFGMVTGETIVPTDVLELVKVTVTGAGGPGASAWVPPKLSSALSQAVEMLTVYAPEASGTLKKGLEPAFVITTPDGIGYIVALRLV